jgi:hypothetical protein
VPEQHTLHALPAVARAIAATMMIAARAFLLLLLAAVLLADDPPVTVDMLARDFLALVVAPEVVAWLVCRAFAASAWLESGRLVVLRGGRGLEVPCASIARVLPWRLPLPLPGVSLVLASGARFPARLALPDPARLLESLAAAGVETARDAQPRSPVRYAAARAAWPRRWYERPPCKVLLFAVLPGAVGFYSFQHIAFGALLGEYYQMGLGAWLRSAFLYWLTAALYLALYAGAIRIAVESALLGAASAAPERTGGARRFAERAATSLFYVSVPILLALRFLT